MILSNDTFELRIYIKYLYCIYEQESFKEELLDSETDFCAATFVLRRR